MERKKDSTVNLLVLSEIDADFLLAQIKLALAKEKEGKVKEVEQDYEQEENWTGGLF